MTDEKVPEQDPRYEVQAWQDTRRTVPDVGVNFLHCPDCLDEWRTSFRGVCSPRDYARQQSAFTADGLQVWCTRHNINISLLVLRAAKKEGVDGPTRRRARRAV